MISRKAATELINLAKQFKGVGVTGPRQTGKTTLFSAMVRDSRTTF